MAAAKARRDLDEEPMNTVERRPTLDEAAEYAERRERAATADGEQTAAGAYGIIADYLKSARYDEPVEKSQLTDAQLQTLIETGEPQVRVLAEQLLLARGALNRIAVVGENEDADTDDLFKCVKIAAQTLFLMKLK